MAKGRINYIASLIVTIVCWNYAHAQVPMPTNIPGVRGFSGGQQRNDSSINDFNTRYPLPYYYVDLGNFGNAAKSLIFSPYMESGWDAGFHSYDVYRYSPNDTRLFTTTRPYTQLGY